MTTENKLIFKHSFNERARVSLVGDTLEVGSLAVGYYHNQDCCENVYADFSAFEHHLKDINELGVLRLEIKAVEDMGIVFFFYENQKRVYFFFENL